MPSNYTEHYQLNQWERSDKVLMEDFNADNAKIDGALGEHTAALEVQAAQIAKRGNCRFYHGTYRGTGTCGPNSPTSVTLPWTPSLTLVASDEDLLILVPGAAKAQNRRYTTDELTVRWSGTTVSWNSMSTSNAYIQLNQSGKTYHVFAFAALS